MTSYRVSNSYEDDPYLHHYVHSQPQSASVANIQTLSTLQSQYYNTNPEAENQTELHRFAQNADRFSTNPVSCYM